MDRRGGATGRRAVRCARGCSGSRSTCCSATTAGSTVEDRARRRLGVVLEPPVVEDVDERLDAVALRAELARALAALPAETREAVLLRVVEQLDYAELAARLGCSAQAARLRVSRGLRALRRGSRRASIAPHDRRRAVMTTEATVAAVRAALLPALAARPAPPPAARRAGPSRCTLVAAPATTGVAAATGVIFAPPKPDRAVPAVAEWTYYAAQPVRRHGRGPVLMRDRPEALARENREAEAAARAQRRHRPLRHRRRPPARLLPPERRPGAAGRRSAPVLSMSERPGGLRRQAAHRGRGARVAVHAPDAAPRSRRRRAPAPTEGYEDC